MSIKLVVLDIAGTTVKDENGVGKAFQSSFRQFGYTLSLETINPLMGYEKKAAVRSMLELCEPNKDRITEALIISIHSTFVSNMLAFYRDTETLNFLPNVEETLSSLHNHGIKIAINTGFSRDIADTICHRLQWREKGLFDYLVASDEVDTGRPEPLMIQKIMEQARIEDPMAVAKVGDTEVDIREGQNAGCRYVIGITTGAFTREELETYRPTHIIDDISELEQILLG